MLYTFFLSRMCIFFLFFKSLLFAKVQNLCPYRHFWSLTSLLFNNETIWWWIWGSVFIPVQYNHSTEVTAVLSFWSTHQQKKWTDKFPAQPPVQSWLKSHHPLDVFTKAVHAWNEHRKFHHKEQGFVIEADAKLILNKQSDWGHYMMVHTFSPCFSCCRINLISHDVHHIFFFFFLIYIYLGIYRW